jgi:hypothetical protein
MTVSTKEMTAATPEEPSASQSGTKRSFAQSAPIAALAVELVVAGVLLAREARRLWFFGDDWSFILDSRISHDPLHTLFVPHNEHWSTLPILVYRSLFTMFGVRHYLPYALAVIVLHLATCVVLWVLLRRVGVGAWICVAVVGIMAFLGAGAENTLWDFQIGFVGSLFFGLLALVLTDRSSRGGGGDWPVWLALVAGLMCSGMGLPMVAAAGVLGWSQRGLRAGLKIVAVPLAVYVVWFAAIGHEGATHDQPTASGIAQVPLYFWTGLTNLGTQVSAVPGSGALILVLLVLPLVVLGVREPAAQVALAGLSGTVVLYLFTGLTRIRFGVDQATASRYVYLGAALLLPLVAWIVQRISRGVPVAVVAFGLVAVLAMVNGVWLAHLYANSRAAKLHGLPQRITAAAQIVQSGQRTLSDLPEPVYNFPITVAKLARSDMRGAFPSSPVQGQGLLDAQSFIQVGASAAPFPGVPAPASVSWAGVIGPTPERGCTIGLISHANAYVDAQLGDRGGMVAITSQAASFNTQLLRDGARGAAARWPAVPGRKIYLASVVPTDVLRIMLPPAGQVTLCVAS